MNKTKAIALAKQWIEQKPQPRELKPSKVNVVLSALGFTCLGEVSADTATRWQHSCLSKDSINFRVPVLKVAVGHSKGSKKVVRIGGVKVLIKALELRLEEENG